jgi:hypothetical protein
MADIFSRMTVESFGLGDQFYPPGEDDTAKDDNFYEVRAISGVSRTVVRATR